MMKPIRSTVYIPLVEQSLENSQLLEVFAENTFSPDRDKKAYEKNWNPVIASLREVNLDHDGLHVVNAIRKLALKKSFWSMYQRIKDYVWLDKQRLYIGNSQFKNCEGSSAQLGLAIALLLNGSNSPIRFALATGSLSTDKPADYDVAVGAVSCVPEKLELIIAKRQINALPSGKLLCFTPTHYKQLGELFPVSDLPQIKTMAALDIEVVPITWLSEAAKKLKATKTRRLIQDNLFDLAAGFGMSALLSVLLYQLWLQRPIPIELLAANSQAEPFQVCTNRDNSEVRYTDLERDGSVPLMPLFNKENSDYNVGLGWKLRAGKTAFSDNYYVAFIHLGEKTGYKLISKYPNKGVDITLAAEAELKWYWPMNEVAAHQQNNVLMIVLQRTPIDAVALEQALEHQFPNAKNNLDVLQASDFLLPQFPGIYAFTYKSVLRNNPCINL